MKYVALLRGINVGGNSMIKMSELKQAFEDAGMKNVSTYINSGNVLFESNEKQEKLVDDLEKTLLEIFKLPIRIVLKSHSQLKEVISDIPSNWKKEDLRCYIAFIKEPATPHTIAKEIIINNDVDSLKVGKHALYMGTKMSGLTKSGFTKLIGKKIYKEMTMRNLNTTLKLLQLMKA